MVRAGCPPKGTVLDLFSGSATTGYVALREGRDYVGLDLNADYLPLAKARVLGDKAPRTGSVDKEEEDDLIWELFG
jgi:DNA modification methylase